MAKKTSTQALGFEEQIWDAACKLRGNIDASEYKNVVLGPLRSARSSTSR